MMKDWLDASLFYVSNEPGFRVNTNPRRTYTISLSSSMMYIRQIQILVQAQICTWLIVYTKRTGTISVPVLSPDIREVPVHIPYLLCLRQGSENISQPLYSPATGERFCL